MKVFTNTKFDGVYPVGVSAIVVARDSMMAAALLNQKLLAHSLNATAKPEDFEEININSQIAIILNDGDY